jgi:hypothetical protein
MRWELIDQPAPAAAPSTPATPGRPISEWHISDGEVVTWTILGIPLMVAGLAVYGLIGLRGGIPLSWSISSTQIIIVLVLTFGLAWAHEAVHGAVMLAFGARPEFGVLRVSRIPAGFYTTSPGHRFSRKQYLIVVIAPLGIPACLLPFGAYLILPFTVNFAGCIGDISIMWRVARNPKGVLFEDLRDGIRFWAPEQGE